MEKFSTWFLPFVPTHNESASTKESFDYMTMSLNASHASINELDYNVHSLYGHMMSEKTFNFLTSQEESPYGDHRPFILTRSSFASTGRYSSHWLGDNWRDWRYMRLSIAGMMNMNMFGIPQAGADVCGFFGDKKDD
jgi:alpha-glucosidase (family GH31 glycosyl hydrolase)